LTDFSLQLKCVWVKSTNPKKYSNPNWSTFFLNFAEPIGLFTNFVKMLCLHTIIYQKQQRYGTHRQQGFYQRGRVFNQGH
jgi:uncharacterized UBP type Zn finger protein